MADDTVAVSVVIPAYNASATIAAQLGALASQRRPFDGEVIVADNGSTDATDDIAHEWRDRLPRLRVVDASARRGPSAARNIGAGAARGRLLLFCDADDVAASDWVERMTAALADHDLVGGVLETRSLRVADAVSVSWEASAEIRLHYWTKYEAGSGSNFGIRRDVFDAMGGYDEQLVTGEDVDLSWRAQLAGHSFGRAQDAVVSSRPRIGLRAVYRQAFSYGKGHRQLRRKYAEYIAADAGRPPLPAEDTVAASADYAPAPRRTLAARLGRVVTPSGRADLTWRIGETLGERLTRADRHIVTLEPDHG